MQLFRVVTAFVVAAVLAGVATPARADDVIPGYPVNPQTERAVIAGVLGLGLGLSLIPVHRGALWDHELFGDADAAVRGQLSLRAAAVSDGLLAASIAAPIAYLTGNTIEDADGDRLLVYGEALAVNVAVFEGVKHLIQRPRPYLYATSPAVARYAADQGDDGYQSFYSAHAATAFCAATAGAYLAAVSTTSEAARAMAWGGGFAIAAAAANLRVRAGKHFYSDVVIGALIGTAIGYAVPALHASKAAYVPRVADLGAAAAGVLGGSLASELVPLERHRLDTRASRPLRALRRAHVHLGPVAVKQGAGLGLAGSL